MARSLFSSAVAAGASESRVIRVRCVNATAACQQGRMSRRQLTCRTLICEFLEYLFCALEESLLAESLASAEHGLIVLRILRECFFSRLLRAFPILALDVARRHVRVDLLDDFVGLWVTWGDNEYRKFERFSCARDEKRTSDRSFGAAALSIGPAPIAEAIPPVLRNRKSGS